MLGHEIQISLSLMVNATTLHFNSTTIVGIDMHKYFLGKDGTRSFITGNFTYDGKDRDHVIDLPCDDLFALKNWLDTYKKKYIYKGEI